MSREKVEKDFETSLTSWQLEKLSDLLDEPAEMLVPVVRDLKRALRKVHITGRTQGGLYDSDRKMFVIPLHSKEQKDTFLNVFSKLGIVPWEENAMLVIEHPDDLKKLSAIGAIPLVEPPVKPIPQQKVGSEKPQVDTVSPALAQAEQLATQVPELPTELEDPRYAFPMGPAQLELSKERRRKARTVPSKVVTEDVDKQAENEEYPIPEDTSEGLERITDDFDSGKVDSTFDAEELKRIFDEFENGHVDDGYEKVVRTLGDVPTLKLFPRTYIWKNKVAHHRLSGEPVSKAEYKTLHEKCASVFEESSEPHEWWRIKQGITDKTLRAGYKAMTELVRMHTGLVVAIERRIKDLYPSANADDLFQEGLIGLMRGIIKYDGRKKLSTIAAYYIEGRMRGSIRRTAKTVYVPTHVQDQNSAYRKVESGLRNAAAGKEPDRLTLAAALSEKGVLGFRDGPVPDYYLDRALDKLQRRNFINAVFDPLDTTSDAFDTHIRHDIVSMTGEPIKDEVSSETAAIHSQARELLYKALDTLPPREKFVLCMRFGIIPPNKPSTLEFFQNLYAASLHHDSDSLEKIFKRMHSVFEHKADRTFQGKYAVSTLSALEENIFKYPKVVPDEALQGMDSRVRFVLAYLGRLSDEQVFRYIYDKEGTFEEIGNVFGTERERIRQIESKALRHLKHPSRKRAIEKAAPADMLPSQE